jgi:hypothetical protein
MGTYWPHLAVLVGAALNLAGLITENTNLITVGTNPLTIGAAVLLQRRSKRSDDG